MEAELSDVIPVVHTSIASTRIVGRVTVGKRWLLGKDYYFLNVTLRISMQQKLDRKIRDLVSPSH